MERHGKLVLLLFVVVALSVGGWLVFGAGGGSGLASGLSTGNESETPATLTTNAALSANAKDAESTALARTTVRGVAERPEEDAEIRAAMAKFVGRVVEHGGQPAAQRVVRFFRLDPQIALQPELDMLSAPIADFPDLVAGEATTAEDGRFAVEGAWPRSIYLIKADADGPNPTILLADRTPGPAETVDLGDIVLKNGAIVTGRVVDESGDPVVGAMVRAADVPAIVTTMVPIEQFDPEGWVIAGNGADRMVLEMPPWVKKYWKELPVPTTLSGADGSFRLEGVDPGMNLVAATKSGFLAATNSVKLDPGQERAIGKLVLREGEIANGTVVDAQGKPIAGVQVVVGSRLSVAPVSFGREATRTDERGQFECSGLKTGDVIAAARRGSGEPWTITEPQSIQRALRITLPTQHVLTVRLISDAGKPIAMPKVALLSVGGAPNAGSITAFATLGFARQVPLAERQRKLEDGRIQFSGLDAARYAVMASAEAHGSTVETVELASDREVEVHLTAAHTIEVRVVNGDDKPIRRAAVYLQLEGKGPNPMPMHVGYTDGDGKLSVKQASRESALIEATHPRYGAAAAKVALPATAPLVIRLAEPGTIDGEVTEEGKPPELGKYMVVANRPWTELRGAVSGMPAMTVLSADGTFALRGLQPGKWRVEVVKSMQAVKSFGSMAEMMMAMRMTGDLPEQDVDLVPGKSVHVRLETKTRRVVDGPSANVSGTAFVNGRPAQGMVVYGWSEQRVSAEVDAVGQFDLGPVKEGNIHLRLVDNSDSVAGFNNDLWSQSVVVKAANDVRLTIEITTGACSGVVYDLEGRPAVGVRVNAMNVPAPGDNRGGGSRGRAMTDSEGRFDFQRLPAGRYTLVADAAALGRGSASVDVLSSGRVTARIALERTFTVAGTFDRKPLDLKQEENMNGVWLSFEYQLPAGSTVPDRGSSSSGSSMVDDDGSFRAKGLAPGSYRVRVYSRASGTWEHERLVEVVDRDLDSIAIVPVQKAPPPPRPPAKQNG